MNQVSNKWSRLHDQIKRANNEAPKLEDDNTVAGLIVNDGQVLADKNIPPVYFLIDKTLPAVGLSMLAGSPKCGKSWECMRIIKEVTDKGKDVFYISCEDNESRLQKRIKMAKVARLDKLKTIAGLTQEKPIPRGAQAIAMLNEIAVRYAPSLIIIDTVASVLDIATPKNGRSDYQVTHNEYLKIRDVAHDHNLAILVVHHTRKATEQEFNPQEMVLGSQATTGTVETVQVMIKRVGKKDCKLHITGKDVEQREYYLKWNGGGFDFAANARLAALGEGQLQVFECIEQHPRIKQSGIQAKLGITQARVSQITIRLKDDNLIRETGRGEYIATPNEDAYDEL